MKIRDKDGSYWTQSRDDTQFGFWSKFEPLKNDKRDFFIIKAIVLYIAMNLEGLSVRLEK